VKRTETTPSAESAASPWPLVPSPSLRFVLVRTSHPGNIGAAARAIRTMGFSRLVLVQPHHGSATVETRTAIGQLMIDNLGAHFAHKPLLTPVR